MACASISRQPGKCLQAERDVNRAAPVGHVHGHDVLHLLGAQGAVRGGIRDDTAHQFGGILESLEIALARAPRFNMNTVNTDAADAQAFDGGYYRTNAAGHGRLRVNVGLKLKHEGLGLKGHFFGPLCANLFKSETLCSELWS